MAWFQYTRLFINNYERDTGQLPLNHRICALSHRLNWEHQSGANRKWIIAVFREKVKPIFCTSFLCIQLNFVAVGLVFVLDLRSKVVTLGRSSSEFASEIFSGNGLPLQSLLLKADAESTEKVKTTVDKSLYYFVQILIYIFFLTSSTWHDIFLFMLKQFFVFFLLGEVRANFYFYLDCGSSV